MLIGEYHHQLDEKNRLRIPAKFRSQLGSNYVILKGSNCCLFVFSQSGFQQFMQEKISLVPISDIKAQKSLRALFSSGFEVDEDAQGRFVLPANLKEFANINKNVVSIGVGSRVELWDEDSWLKYNNSADFDAVLEDLTQYGI